MLAGFGEINVNAALPVQTVSSTALAVVTGWQNNGPQGSGDSAVVPDQAANRLRLEAGTYLVLARLSLLIGANGAGDFTFQIMRNGVLADAKLTSKVTAGAAAARATVSISGLLTIAPGDLSPQTLPNQPSWDPRFPSAVQQALLQLGATSSVGGAGIGFVVEAGSLMALRIGG